jgi:hypothetical protein
LERQGLSQSAIWDLRHRGPHNRICIRGLLRHPHFSPVESEEDRRGAWYWRATICFSLSPRCFSPTAKWFSRLPFCFSSQGGVVSVVR